MGSKERREREKLATRQRILDAARELFVEVGYEDVTMRKIADRIEYSPTAIYLHFEDKEALMTELSVCDFRSFTEAFAHVPPNPDPTARLFDLARALVGFALAYPHQYRLLFMTPRPAPTPEVLAAKPEIDAYDLLLAAVDDARVGGVVDPSWDRHEVAQVLWGSLHGLVSLQIVMPQGRVELLPVDRLVRTTCSGLLEAFRRPVRAYAYAPPNPGEPTP